MTLLPYYLSFLTNIFTFRILKSQQNTQSVFSLFIIFVYSAIFLIDVGVACAADSLQLWYSQSAKLCTVKLSEFRSVARMYVFSSDWLISYTLCDWFNYRWSKKILRKNRTNHQPRKKQAHHE